MAIRIGIVGCGAIANLHAASYQKLGDRVELVACCDVEKGRADAFVERYGFKKSYSDEKQMLEECELDAVSVCTWNSQHKPCTMLALDAGVNVLCEKPMAMNTAEALEMEECARRNGKLLMIGFVRRHGNDAATALDFINKGYLGDIYCAKVSYLRRAGFPGNWFGDKSYSGGGPLIDLGVHVIDLSRYLCGNPKPVTVFGATFSKLGARKNLKSVVLPWESTSDVKKKEYKFDVEDFVTAMIRFDNGLLVMAEASFSLNIEKDTGNVELLGTKAGLTLSPFVLHTECNDMLADTVIRANIGEGDFFRAEMENFVNAIEGIAPCKAPAEDGVELMRILDAIYESAETGKSVDIVR